LDSRLWLVSFVQQVPVLTTFLGISERPPPPFFGAALTWSCSVPPVFSELRGCRFSSRCDSLVRPPTLFTLVTGARSMFSWQPGFSQEFKSIFPRPSTRVVVQFFLIGDHGLLVAFVLNMISSPILFFFPLSPSCVSPIFFFSLTDTTDFLGSQTLQNPPSGKNLRNAPFLDPSETVLWRKKPLPPLTYSSSEFLSVSPSSAMRKSLNKEESVRAGVSLPRFSGNTGALPFPLSFRNKIFQRLFTAEDTKRPFFSQAPSRRTFLDCRLASPRSMLYVSGTPFLPP